MKKSSVLLLILISISSSMFAQDVIRSKQHSSVFSDFNQLGVKKELFIKKFGNPISKDMSYDQDKNKIEILYYKENLKKEDVIIITEFTFKNEDLIKQKSRIETFVIDRKLMNKISDDLTFIRHRVQLKLVP